MKPSWLVALTCLTFSHSAFAQKAVTQADSLKQIQLFEIVRSGETGKLEELLNTGLNANDSIDRYSLLMMAAMSGSLEEMKVLVRHGAMVNYMNRDSLTALWLAIPDPEKTLFLLDHGADMYSRTTEGRTMIMKLALMPGSAGLIRLFISKGMDPRQNNPENILIVNAVFSADTSNLLPFLEAGLDVNGPDHNGNAPIIDACSYVCYPTIKMIVEHGADVNAIYKNQLYTPLMNAAGAGDAETTELLIQKGADVRLLDSTGFNALMWLALADIDRPDIVEAMCKGLGDQLYKKGTDGTTAPFWMKKKGNNKSVQVITKYSALQP